MQSFSSLDRTEILQTLANETFDLLVIGGGITGCGIALDAASRGLKTVLLEKDDFASGTSSRSTKLIHGGLRYLKQFEIALVREVGMERARVHKVAPHLVNAEKMMIPILKGGSFSKLLTSIGLLVYDILAGVERADQRKMLNKAEALKAEPLLPEELVEGGALYAEYRTDDARLTVENVKTSIRYGGQAVNYVRVEDFLYDNGTIVGARCSDMQEDRLFDLRARYVISAAGPWVDDLRAKNRSLSGKHLFLTKGVHLVVPHERFPVQQAIYFDVPDGRMIFAIPRGNVTYIGTTDTPYNGVKEAVTTTLEDARYLIDAVNHTFNSVDLKLEDVQSSWAGLRPLIYEEGKSASEISRKDEVFESDTGLISIAGGKLTGYRKMAQKVVDIVAKRYQKDTGRKLKKCFTDEIPLEGGIFESAQEVERYSNELASRLPEALRHRAGYLVGNYGRQSEKILELYDQRVGQDAEVKLALAELQFSVENEMVLQPMDFFNRRTGRLYFDIASIPHILKPVLSEFERFFGWGEEQREKAKRAVEEELKKASEFS